MEQQTVCIQFLYNKKEKICNVYRSGQRIAYTVKNKKGGYDFIGLYGHIIAGFKARTALAAAKAVIAELYEVNK